MIVSKLIYTICGIPFYKCFFRSFTDSLSPINRIHLVNRTKIQSIHYHALRRNIRGKPFNGPPFHAPPPFNILIPLHRGWNPQGGSECESPPKWIAYKICHQLSPQIRGLSIASGRDSVVRLKGFTSLQISIYLPCFCTLFSLSYIFKGWCYITHPSDDRIIPWIFVVAPSNQTVVLLNSTLYESN